MAKNKEVPFWYMYVMITILATVFWIFQSSMEAKAYNNATGNDISTWEAMWVELRIDSNPK